MAMARKVTLNKTYAQMQSLIAANKLDTQTCYKITDRGDRGMVFRAATTNQLEFDGIRYMLCPATYAATTDEYDNVWIGVWNATKQDTASEGELTIWNGHVWKAGAELSGDAPDTEASGWVVVPKATFANHEYVEIIFSVSYDFAEDWISKQWDRFDNVFGLPKLFSALLHSNAINYIDYCDWNFMSSGGFLFGNRCFSCYNNNAVAIHSNKVSEIRGNNVSGMINSNVLGGMGSIYDNTLTGNIADNTNIGNINGNTPGGSIASNSNLGAISGNSNVGEIASNSNLGAISTNSNEGFIIYNSNGDAISTNSNTGNMELNANNGVISGNSNLAETTCNISGNINNGAITGVWDANVTDAEVTKTGSAS